MCDYKVGHSLSVVMRRLALMSDTKHYSPQPNCCNASANCKVHVIYADQYGWDIVGVSNGNMSCDGCMNLTLYHVDMIMSYGVYANCGVCIRIISQLVRSIASSCKLRLFQIMDSAQWTRKTAKEKDVCVVEDIAKAYLRIIDRQAAQPQVAYHYKHGKCLSDAGLYKIWRWLV